MGDIRARDADRDRYVEVLEAAYADGQLGAEDRELRVTRALQAETLAELDMITRDLQGRPAPVPASAAPPRPVAKPKRWSGAGVGAAAAAVLLLGLAAFVLPADTGSATSIDAVESGPVVRGEATVSPVEERDGFEMAPADVRAFLRSYESEFGTLETYDACCTRRA